MAGLQGRVFGGYELAEQLKSSGLAEVYRARPTTPGSRDVVVKVIYPEFARQPGFIPNFRQIVQMSGKLANHPHILPLVGSGEQNGYFYLITPYVAAGTLRDWLGKGGRLGAADVAPFFRQLCDALTYAHSLGVIHGNIKPSNIFLFEGRHVLLGDFGMLWDIRQMDLEHAGSGTEAVEFLAPEVTDGQGHITQLGDVYSVGALLFTALVGHAPFRGNRPAEVFAASRQQPTPHLGQVNAGFPGAVLALDSVVQRAMAKRPEERFASATAIAQAVEAAVRQAPAQPAQHGGFVAPAQTQAQLGAPMLGIAGAVGGVGMGAFGSGPVGSGPVGSGPMGNGPVGAAIPVVGSLFKPLDPPFPPLPPTHQPDETMEHGRVLPQRADLDQLSTQHVPSPAIAMNDLTVDPTMRMAAPALPHLATSIPSSDQAWPDLSGPLTPDGSGAGGAAPSEPAPSVRPNNPFGRARSGLGQRIAQQQSGGPALDGVRERDAGGLGGAGDAAGLGGFMVAGGAKPGNAMPGGAGVAPDAALEQQARPAFGIDGEGEAKDYSRFSAENPEWATGLSAALPAPAGSGAFQRGAWESTSREREASDESVEFPGFGRGGMGSDDDSRAYNAPYAFDSREMEARPGRLDDRPFSATQLGLPNLTMPSLDGELPPTWQDALGEQRPAGGAGAQNQWRGEAEEWGDSGERVRDWRAEREPQQSAGGRAAVDSGPWDADAAWSAAEPHGSTWQESVALSAALPAIRPSQGGAWTTSDHGAVPLPNNAPAKGREKRRALRSFEDFENERVWTVGMTAVRRRGRLLRPIAFFALLLLVFDVLGLMVARPDLCPVSGCHTLSQRIHQVVPFLHNTPTAAPSVLSVSPANVAITTPMNKAATTTVTLVNSSAAPVTWQATSQLQWLSVAPSAGSLQVGAQVTLTMTARPANVKAGAYTSAIIIMVDGKTTITLPVTVTVQASAALPSGFAFASGVPSRFLRAHVGVALVGQA